MGKYLAPAEHYIHSVLNIYFYQALPQTPLHFFLRDDYYTLKCFKQAWTALAKDNNYLDTKNGSTKRAIQHNVKKQPSLQILCTIILL